jgi:HSP20 family protein
VARTTPPRFGDNANEHRFLICINVIRHRPVTNDEVITKGETQMAMTPVEVKRPEPAPDAWRQMRTEMERVFDRFGFGLTPFRNWFDFAPEARTPFTMPSPVMDIVEEETDYKLTAELPGMAEQDVEVVVSGDTLTVKGKKKQETERKEKNFSLSERSYGSFRRSFYLPDGVDRDKIAAAFAKGVLTVTLPKSVAAATSKTIEVKAAA